MQSACFGDTLGPGNGAPSVQAYSPDPRRSFGWQLPGPFILCAGVGSHLTRLSDPRLRLTTPVRSLYFSYPVAKRLIPSSLKVKSHCPSVSEFGIPPAPTAQGQGNSLQTDSTLGQVIAHEIWSQSARFGCILPAIASHSRHCVATMYCSSAHPMFSASQASLKKTEYEMLDAEVGSSSRTSS